MKLPTMQLVALGVLLGGYVCNGALVVSKQRDGLHTSSPYLRLTVSPEQPGFSSLVVDGLGQNKVGLNALRAPGKTDVAYVMSLGVPTAASNAGKDEAWVSYWRRDAGLETPPGWAIVIGEREIWLISQWSEIQKPEPVLLNFDSELAHPALLGQMNKDGSIQLPAVLHIPNQGSLRITTPDKTPLSLGYDAHRGDPAEANFIKVTFPPASKDRPRVEYRCKVTAICPSLSKAGDSEKLIGYQRNWLNIIQPHPRLRLLANNATSDACAMCMYEYADIAVQAPQLAEGLTALDVIRYSLDRYLAGVIGLGLPGYVSIDDPKAKPSDNPPYLDTYPSLLIAVADYVQGSGDRAWLERNYAGVKKWLDAMLAMDHDGNGLIEYAGSGNDYFLKEKYPGAGNWWDTVNFGHEDAYSNALAYRALRQMAAVIEAIGKRDDAARYRAAAQKLHDAYFKTLYNPDTGILAGWRSADGQLHDYWFPFVSGIAIHYGLVPKDKANDIMDRLLAKMKEVGYTRFDLGLPGNLVAIPLRDYRQNTRWRFGGGTKEDGSEGFQHYENGGATAAFAYFTLAALYDLGRHEEADRILLPMLGAFDRAEFEGREPNSRSKDWKDWKGAAFGYENYLADNYYALLALVARDRTLRGLKMEQ
jgi:hypothetical protein